MKDRCKKGRNMRSRAKNKQHLTAKRISATLKPTLKKKNSIKYLRP